MSTAQQKTLEDFIHLQNRNALSHSIRAAVELGVIRALREGQKTAEQLSSELEVDPKALTRLMDVLTTSELIEKYGENYALSMLATLIPDQFFDFGDQHWRHLATHVKTGVPLPAQKGIATTDFDYCLNKASEEWTLTPTALSAAQVLDLGNSRRGLKILEIGCGSAVFGATLAHADSESVVSLLDDELGLERARKTVENIGLEQQFNYIEADPRGNLTDVPELSDQMFDLVLMVGQIHQRSPQECQELFAQLHSVIKPDCELVLVDIFPGQENMIGVRTPAS